MALQTSHPSLLLDYFRVPSALCEAPAQPDLALVRGDQAALWWAHSTETRARPLLLGGIRLYCRVLRAERQLALLAELGGEWERSNELADVDGTPLGAVWRSTEGSVLLPLDPGEAMLGLWSEAYQTSVPSRSALAKRVAMRIYYRIRPLLPRAGQIWLRRRFSRIQARTPFPRWPVEPSLHDFYDFIFDLLASIDGRPVPTIAPWPAGRSWALVLTHDVETSLGYANIGVMRDLELAAGYRSSWNLVARRYDVEDTTVAELERLGFEVGVHGLYHDGRDLGSRELLLERLPEMRAWGERWRAVGFRSPATHRSWELMPLLGFDYDSSSPDTDPFEPQSGGCCTWLPFLNRELVELPITLVQDHTLFVILRRGDERLWVEKADYLRSRGGLALLITHPDYMLDHDRLVAYKLLLEHYASDEDAWRALPREVSDWWRRRAASSLRREGSGWQVIGPAADEARVAFLGTAR
jgi:hypothetical protein